MSEERVRGCLLGMAVGDALGLPLEGISRQRQERMATGEIRHRFLFGRGMVSDDTEHACLVARAVLESGGDVEVFTRVLARGMRWWLVGLPAGVGFATLRATIKLWLGCSWRRSGVSSAGNGPAMRSPILGVLFPDDWERCRELVGRSTRLTHTDPKALAASLAVALAAQHARSAAEGVPAQGFLRLCQERLRDFDPEIVNLIQRVVDSVDAGEDTLEFADGLGLARGVTGYSYHTVPVVLHAWLSSPDDYERAIATVIACGGDTDTTGAIVGGIVGAGVGEAGIPSTWRDGLWEWPVTLRRMQALAAASAHAASREEPSTPPKTYPLARALRNQVFLAVVLFHGFRRLLPPY